MGITEEGTAGCATRRCFSGKADTVAERNMLDWQARRKASRRVCLSTLAAVGGDSPAERLAVGRPRSVSCRSDGVCRELEHECEDDEQDDEQDGNTTHARTGLLLATARLGQLFDPFVCLVRRAFNVRLDIVDVFALCGVGMGTCSLTTLLNKQSRIY